MLLKHIHISKICQELIDKWLALPLIVFWHLSKWIDSILQQLVDLLLILQSLLHQDWLCVSLEIRLQLKGLLGLAQWKGIQKARRDINVGFCVKSDSTQIDIGALCQFLLNKIKFLVHPITDICLESFIVSEAVASGLVSQFVQVKLEDRVKCVMLDLSSISHEHFRNNLVSIEPPRTQLSLEIALIFPNVKVNRWL